VSLRFELPGGGQVLFTDRAHGNLSSVGGEGAEQGSAARERLRELIGVERLARGYQVHGAVVRRVAVGPASDVAASEAGDSVEADGQATANVGVGTMVLSADCLPVALGCDGAVAMVHAGWRGLAVGVLEEGARAIGELGQGGEVVAVVGPCAGACCYEVGPEVHDALAGAHRHGTHLDLRAVAHERLRAAGVAEVRDVHACTVCDERFFSYRREGERAGRQAGVAWLS
jgi:purine-nucleoside/S-methyl-5'-thioadenosine phosphorylase / adenosine deaminase